MRIAKAYCKCGAEIYEADCVDAECEFNHPYDWSRDKTAPSGVVGCALDMNSWCFGTNDYPIEHLEFCLRIVVSRLHFWFKAPWEGESHFDDAVKALLEASLASMAKRSYA